MKGTPHQMRIRMAISLTTHICNTSNTKFISSQKRKPSSKGTAAKKKSSTKKSGKKSTALNESLISEENDSDRSMSTDTDSQARNSSNLQTMNSELINRSGLGNFMLHLRLLLQKNYLLFSRNLKPTLCQVLAPVFFCLIIIFF